MPTDTIIIVTAVLAAFAFFMAMLAYVSFTENRQRAAVARLSKKDSKTGGRHSGQKA